MTKSLLRSINRKNNLYYKYKTNPTDFSKRKYTAYKNVLTSLLRREKKMYFSRQLNNFKNNSKQTWNVINRILNKNKDKQQISEINNNGNILKEPCAIAESFNNYFSNIGINLANNIPPSNQHFTDFLKEPNPNSLFFDPVHEAEILDIVNNLDNKKSCGHDGINNIVLKYVISEIAQPLAHVFNLSVSSGIVPDDMKLAKVIPIFKKGDENETSNYRPISLLTCLSKLLEKVVYSRTIDFLKHHNTFFDFQFGFREKHNTTHAILTLINKITQASDQHCHTIGVFLDFSKAFDTINHDILLYKLSYYGIRGKALEWFRSYLQNRRQFVSIHNKTSSTHDINC